MRGARKRATRQKCMMRVAKQIAEIDFALPEESQVAGKSGFLGNSLGRTLRVKSWYSPYSDLFRV